jgi:hypothetical protein
LLFAQCKMRYWWLVTWLDLVYERYVPKPRVDGDGDRDVQTFRATQSSLFLFEAVNFVKAFLTEIDSINAVESGHLTERPISSHWFTRLKQTCIVLVFFLLLSLSAHLARSSGFSV